MHALNRFEMFSLELIQCENAFAVGSCTPIGRMMMSNKSSTAQVPRAIVATTEAGCLLFCDSGFSNHDIAVVSSLVQHLKPVVHEIDTQFAINGP